MGTSPLKSSLRFALRLSWKSLREKAFGVLYVVDPVGEYAVQRLKKFDGKKLKTNTKEGLDIEYEDVRIA